MKSKNNKSSVVIGISALAVLAAPVVAQDNGGRRASLTVSQTLKYSDNIDFDASAESDLTAQTDLRFSLSSETRADQFALTIGASLETNPSDGTDLNLVNPTINLSYGRQSRSASVSATVSYRESDVNTFDFGGFDADTGTIFLVASEGTRAQLDMQVSADFGIDAPFGGTVTLGHSELSYTDTVDPDLVEKTTDSLATKLRFLLNPGVSFTAGANYGVTDEAGDGLDQTRQGLDIGIAMDVRPGLNAGVSVGYDRVETTGGPVSDPTDRVEDGVSLGANATLEMPNGSLSGSISSRIGENGRRSSASIDRGFDLKNGSVELSFGVTETEEGGLNPLYGINYVHDLKRGQFGASLNQAVVSQSDGDEALISGLRVSYDQELTTQIGLGASLSIGDTSALAGDVEDAQRLDATVSLSHTLTRDWDVKGGYTYSEQRSESDDTISSSTVFVGLSRGFDWRW